MALADSGDLSCCHKITFTWKVTATWHCFYSLLELQSTPGEGCMVAVVARRHWRGRVALQPQASWILIRLQESKLWWCQKPLIWHVGFISLLYSPKIPNFERKKCWIISLPSLRRAALGRKEERSLFLTHFLCWVRSHWWNCSLKCQSSVSILMHPVAESFEKVIPSGQESGFRRQAGTQN